MQYSKDANLVDSQAMVLRHASWIWPHSLGQNPNHYVEFRHEFQLTEVGDRARLLLSVDSNYIVWVNGTMVDFGQYHDYPDAKTFDSLDVTTYLKTGTNVLCIMVYYQGVDSSQYITGLPGVIYALQTSETAINSGEETCWRLSPAYQHGPMPRLTAQMGFTFQAFASSEASDWRSCDYVMGSDWHAITAEDFTHDIPVSLKARPISKLVTGERLAARLIAQGVFIRSEVDGASSIAQQMQRDLLSSRRKEEIFEEKPSVLFPGDVAGISCKKVVAEYTGIYLLFDLGKEVCGVIDIELEAQAGTQIDIAWGEHLDDLRVRSYVGGRHFAGTYLCKTGRQRFAHYFQRIAGRYLQLHITPAGERLALHYIGLLPTDYPVVTQGQFHCSDSSLDAIYNTSVQTLRLCMHEHYEDCPWREQALYAMDMRNQALSGYYCFGDYSFAAASLELLGAGLADDGYLELCAPAKVPITIPCFSMAWILALADHLRYSGDLALIRRQLPIVCRMLDSYHAQMFDGLLPSPTGARYWHLYEWADGLDGSDDIGFFGALQTLRYDAPLNMFLCMALEAAAFLLHHAGESALAQQYMTQAQSLQTTIHEKFWDLHTMRYRTYSINERSVHFAELTQALALLSSVCPSKHAAELRSKLAAGEGGIKTTLSHSFYKYEALLQEAEAYTGQVFQEIHADWGYMLRQGATSFWETLKGADDFDDAGSLCHGWSAIPVYFIYAYLLGVKPLEPGFTTFSFRPNADRVGELYNISGQIPTPFGQIRIDLDARPQLLYPEQTRPMT